MPKIQITFSRDFFNNETGAYANKTLVSDLDTVDALTAEYGNIYNVSVNYFNELKENTDTFTKLPDYDKTEISRGESYKVNPALSLPITYESFKDFLTANNIHNEKVQGLILIMLLQHRWGLPFAIGAGLNVFALYLTESVYESLTIGTNAQKTSLTFDEQGNAKFHIIFPVLVGSTMGQDTTTSSQCGHAETDIYLSPEGKINFSDITMSIEENEKKSLKEVKNKLDEMISLSNKFKENIQPKQEAPISKKSTNQFGNFLRNNPWKIAALAGSVILGGIGIALTLTGIFSPIGLAFTALSAIGVNFSLAGTSLLVANAAISASIGAIGVGIAKGVSQISASKPAPTASIEQPIVKQKKEPPVPLVEVGNILKKDG